MIKPTNVRGQREYVTKENDGEKKIINTKML